MSAQTIAARRLCIGRLLDGSYYYVVGWRNPADSAELSSLGTRAPAGWRAALPQSQPANTIGRRLAGRCDSKMTKRYVCLRLGKIQLHADAVGIIEKKLRVAGTGHDALAELHLPGLQTLADTFDVAGGEGDMVEPAGVFILLLGSAHHDAFPRLARPHQVHGGSAAGIEPIAGEIERRALAVFQSEHVAIELLAALQIGGFDREMLQSAEWHGLLPRRRLSRHRRPSSRHRQFQNG